jgi:hypothetical protein
MFQGMFWTTAKSTQRVWPLWMLLQIHHCCLSLNWGEQRQPVYKIVNIQVADHECEVVTFCYPTSSIQ